MPFVAAIVPEVDVAAGRVVVDPPPGLLDDDACSTSGDVSRVRIDVVTIFPDYLAPLELSLLGKARERRPARRARARPARLDPRPAPHRRRHPVRRRRRHGDDARAVGRGARRRARAAGAATGAAVLVVPTPAGAPFTQALRRRSWPREPWLVFACGRYEGIDRAGRRRRRDADAASRGLARRLRARRRRGRRRWSSSRPSPGCCPACSATPSRWPRSRHADGPAGVPRLHQAAALARARGARGAAVAATTAAIAALAARRGAAPDRRAAPGPAARARPGDAATPPTCAVLAELGWDAGRRRSVFAAGRRCGRLGRRAARQPVLLPQGEPAAPHRRRSRPSLHRPHRPDPRTNAVGDLWHLRGREPHAHPRLPRRRLAAHRHPRLPPR